jgi:hypothetical protein
MTEEKKRENQVWVFNGNRNHFPSAVFTDRQLAEEWIKENHLTGTLTAYPLDVSIYDWTIAKGYFSVKKEEHKTSKFIANFSSAYQEHYHYGEDEEG